MIDGNAALERMYMRSSCSVIPECQAKQDDPSEDRLLQLYFQVSSSQHDDEALLSHTSTLALAESTCMQGAQLICQKYTHNFRLMLMPWCKRLLHDGDMASFVRVCCCTLLPLVLFATSTVCH